MASSMESLRIATLKEALSLAEELGLGLVVEMKEEGLEGLVAEALAGKNCIVTSFYHSSLRELSDISDLKTGIIISSLPINPVQLALWARAGGHLSEASQCQALQGGPFAGDSGLSLDRQQQGRGELALAAGSGRPGNR